MVELADTPDLGSGARACRFKSCHPHYGKIRESDTSIDVTLSLIFRNPEDSLNRFKVSASLRSAQNRGHTGPRAPCHSQFKRILKFLRRL